MRSFSGQQAGFSLIEVLVSLLILLIGFMGVAALSMRANQVEFESYQRAQALVLVDDMAQRVRANQHAAGAKKGRRTPKPSPSSVTDFGSSMARYGSASIVRIRGSGRFSWMRSV